MGIDCGCAPNGHHHHPHRNEGSKERVLRVEEELLSKIDLLPHLSFDIEQCKAFARQLNPQVRLFELSCQSGVGLDLCYDWLRQELTSKRSAPTVDLRKS